MAIALNRDKVIYSGGHDPKHNTKKHISMTVDGEVVEMDNGEYTVILVLTDAQHNELKRVCLVPNDKIKSTLNFVRGK